MFEQVYDNNTAQYMPKKSRIIQFLLLFGIFLLFCFSILKFDLDYGILNVLFPEFVNY